ncbi:MAG TPA: hypothetical protein VER17_12235 [Tepidisphaeraceae bacterium]|nr:hypothetical protein [Tepidisphaeraceae bacterium]
MTTSAQRMTEDDLLRLPRDGMRHEWIQRELRTRRWCTTGSRPALGWSGS